MIRECQCLHTQANGNDADDASWQEINSLRVYLAKSSTASKSLFCRIKEALIAGDYDAASAMQIEMSAKIEELKTLYSSYKKNMIDCCCLD